MLGVTLWRGLAIRVDPLSFTLVMVGVRVLLGGEDPD